MAPTEATILSTFLISPAPLPSIISLRAFTELFPRSLQSSPQIKALYRDLQHQRSRLTDAITRNIGAEVKRGNAQRRVIIRARRAAEKEEQDDEVVVERAVSYRPTKFQLSISVLIHNTAVWFHFQSTSIETTYPNIHFAGARSRSRRRRGRDPEARRRGRIAIKRDAKYCRRIERSTIRSVGKCTTSGTSSGRIRETREFLRQEMM